MMDAADVPAAEEADLAEEMPSDVDAELDLAESEADAAEAAEIEADGALPAEDAADTAADETDEAEAIEAATDTEGAEETPVEADAAVDVETEAAEDTPAEAEADMADETAEAADAEAAPAEDVDISAETEYAAGDVSPAPVDSGIDFGNDTSEFALDGECDDARFTGEGMTSTALIEEDIGRDATDCRAAFEAGRLELRDAEATALPSKAETPAMPVEEEAAPVAETEAATPEVEAAPAETGVPSDGILFNGINFGDNSSQWANDGECDDPRFEGTGMTQTPLLDEDAYRDANDCLAAWRTGGLRMADE